MTKKKINEVLHGLGLSEKEALVYYASLSLGPTTILRIARAAELKRTTVYSVIEALKQRGLMSIEVKGFKKFFVAEDPKTLESMLDVTKARLHASLPDLYALYNTKGGDAVKYYEGLAAIKLIYKQLLHDISPGEDYLVIANDQAWFDLDRDYFQHFTEQRAKLPITTKLLLEDSPAAREHQRFARNWNESIKILPPNTKLTTNLVVTPQRVVIHQLTPPIVAIVITHVSVIKMHRELFAVLWSALSVNRG